MTRLVHSGLVVVGLNGQTYDEYKKFVARNTFIRGVVENVYARVPR
jgi:hypothetical protein